MFINNVNIQLLSFFLIAHNNIAAAIPSLLSKIEVLLLEKSIWIFITKGFNFCLNV